LSLRFAEVSSATDYIAPYGEDVTPADVYVGRQQAVITERSMIKRRTME
jgi:hypothetical protein